MQPECFNFSQDYLSHVVSYSNWLVITSRNVCMVYFSVSPSFCLSSCLPISICISVCLALANSHSLSIPPSIYVCIYACMYVCLSIYACVCNIIIHTHTHTHTQIVCGKNQGLEFQTKEIFHVIYSVAHGIEA
jgi:hypothetical protein